jgi:hypothetical protein
MNQIMREIYHQRVFAQQVLFGGGGGRGGG